MFKSIFGTFLKTVEVLSSIHRWNFCSDMSVKNESPYAYFFKGVARNLSGEGGQSPKTDYLSVAPPWVGRERKKTWTQNTPQR